MMIPWQRASIAGVALLVAAMIPVITQDQYVLRVLVIAALFVVMAVTYDLIVGQTGSLSLAHPTFYGIGAYAVAILVTSYDVGFPLAFAAAALLSFIAAIAIGIPAFRLSEQTFAIGTLGFAVVLQLVANNWIDLTNGPMCTTGVRPLEFTVGRLTFSSVVLTHAYYGALVLAAGVTLIVWAITSSRVGRAFARFARTRSWRAPKASTSRSINCWRLESAQLSFRSVGVITPLIAPLSVPPRWATRTRSLS